MAVLNFDSSQVAPSTGAPEAIPAGWYNVIMDESEIKPTKNSDPQSPSMYLLCRFNVLDGQYQGRKVFTRLNIINPNPQATEIARKDLSAICHAVGAIGLVQDSSMLHGRPLKVKVGYRPATTEYEAQNDIKAYRNINEPTDTVTGAPAAANPGMPAHFPPPQQPAQWAPPQGAQQAPAPAYAAPQQPQQGQPSYPPAQAPQQAPNWQQPANAQPWNNPAPAPAQYAPAPVPQNQQYAPPPATQYAPPPQAAPAGNPAGNEPPPWHRQ